MTTENSPSKSKEQLFAEKMVSLQIKFIRKIPGRLDELAAGIQAADWSMLHDLGHKIKGTSACLGLDNFSKVGIKIQDAANEKNSNLLKGLSKDLSDLTDRWCEDTGQKAS